MKKIYMILAAITLLSMSLNAQIQPNKQAPLKAVDENIRGLNSGTKDAPADAVSVPYYNSMNTSDERGQLGTYDANGDASGNQGKWGLYYTDDTQTDICAQYLYSSSNAANDYLFIGVPVILQAGNSYTFSMDVATGGYNEKYEVVMFSELTTASIAAAAQVIPVTTTSVTTTTRIQSEPFTVSEESYMYFAVHCVSDADMYFLTVDNLAIEAVASTTPELTAPTNGSTVNVGTNDGFGASTTVNVSGNNLTADLSVSVSGTGFSVSPTTITAADANAGTTVTVTYNGTDPNATGTLTITSSNGEVSTVTVNLTASYAASTAIQGGLLRLHLLMVDQFKEEIPDDNKHPEAYGYVLKYEPEVGDPKVSGKPDVRIQKTKAKVNGYYTKAEIDGDTDAGLTMNVLTADVEMDLDSENPDILYFEMKGKKDAAPTIEDPYLTKLQYMKNIGMYEEMEQTSPNLGAHYNPAETHHYYDASTPILTGGTNNFMTYAPMVSTWGVERRYFEDDGLDNTYGAPIWKTAVGQVEIQGKPSLQKQVINAGTANEAANPSTSWTVDGQLYTLYFMGVSAQGTLPSPNTTNINYEPYMFRVFVEGDNLRKFVPVTDPETGVRIGLSDGGPIVGKYCIGSFDASTGTWSSSDLSFSKSISEDAPTSSNPGWEGNMMFGAPFDLDGEDLTVYVRFYYMVEGWNANRAGDARPGNGSESPGASPDDPETYVHEFIINGEVVSRTYVNAQGMQSDKPFDGINIVVTRYSDGTVTTTKVIR